MMTLPKILVLVFLVSQFLFGLEIQARWIGVEPYQVHIKTKYHRQRTPIPKDLFYKSDKTMYRKYCRFLQELNLILGACQKWRAKYHVFKQKQEMKKTTTTIHPLVKNTSSI